MSLAVISHKQLFTITEQLNRQSKAGIKNCIIILSHLIKNITLLVFKRSEFINTLNVVFKLDI